MWKTFALKLAITSDQILSIDFKLWAFKSVYSSCHQYLLPGFLQNIMHCPSYYKSCTFAILRCNNFVCYNLMNWSWTRFIENAGIKADEMHPLFVYKYFWPCDRYLCLQFIYGSSFYTCRYNNNNVLWLILNLIVESSSV